MKSESKGRKVIDCREMGGECTVSIEGSEKEVLTLARHHAIKDHGYKAGAELDHEIRAMMHAA